MKSVAREQLDRVAASVPGAPSPGDTLAGRFRLEAHAGFGASGIVFRARDLRSGEMVALKLLYPDPRNEHRPERNWQEARVLAAVEHPAVVRYVAHGCTEAGAPFVAMGWVEGETLAERLAGRGLSPRESLCLALRLSSGLAALHARGIVHRDLKPSNVLLPGGDVTRACIVDLGVACEVNKPALAGAGTYVGTPRYMAPEQIRDPQRVEGRSDVFALGCILYECLCGVPAFDAGELFAVLAQILFAPLPTLRSRRPELPRELEHLLSTLLARRPERRPEAGAALNAKLQDALDSPAGEALEMLRAPEREAEREPAYAITAGSGLRIVSAEG